MENYAGGIRIIFGNSGNTNNRSVGPVLYWGAINEAFADLYARYTRNSADGQLTGVDCFAKSRDVESPIFGDSTPKIYSSEVHAAFMSTQELDGNSSCDAPDFQGIHSIGAIMAHALNAGFESVTEDVAKKRVFGSVKEKSIFKGDMLLRWARKMGGQIKSNYSVTLGSFVRDAFVTMAEARQEAGYPAGELGVGQCQIVSSLVPALASEIIANGGLRCAQ